MTALTSLTGTQNYLDGDGLLRRYGTDKTVPGAGGEFRNYGPTREIEFMLDLTKLTTTAQIVEEQIFLPNTVWLESVQIDCQIAGATGTSFSIGIVGTTRDSTVATDTAIINAETSFTLGKVVLYDATTAQHGTLIGTVTSTAAFFPAYITAKQAGSAFTAGLLKVRIRYRSGTVTTQ